MDRGQCGRVTRDEEEDDGHRGYVCKYLNPERTPISQDGQELAPPPSGEDGDDLMIRLHSCRKVWGTG